jgi:ribosomal 50S subunit-associated protein YjgA (DUF615 family)
MEDEKRISELREERVHLLTVMRLTSEQSKITANATEYKRKMKRLKEVSSELHKLTNNPIYLIK